MRPSQRMVVIDEASQESDAELTARFERDASYRILTNNQRLPQETASARGMAQWAAKAQHSSTGMRSTEVAVPYGWT